VRRTVGAVQLTLTELEFGADGEPTVLSATFALRCVEFPSPENPDVLKGRIHFDA
jgi:hypothetical protein